MNRRTLALLAAAVLALTLLGATALAAEEDSAPSTQAEQLPDTDSSVPKAEEPQADEPDQSEPQPPEEEPAIEEYIPDPVGSLSFANLSRRMHEGNLQILSIQESIDTLEEIDYDKLKEQLREQLNELAKTQWTMVMMSDYMSDYEYHSAYNQLDQAYDAVREQFDAIKDGDMQEDNADTVRQLKNLQNQIVMAGEATYIALVAMEQQEGGLERQLAALDRQITELELRYQLGHISSLTLKQAKAGRAALTSGISTLGMNLNTYKGQLELLIGADITGEIALSSLPAVRREEVAAMDLEADLETAKANSWDLYQAGETYKDALKEYNNHGGEAGLNNATISDSYKRARHTYYSAKYTYDNTVQNFELGLRNLYLKVKDYQQVLDASRTALAAEQDNYSVAQLKYSQGNLSQNGLLEAEDKVTEAKEKVAGAENDLFSSYNTYRWAVDYGILN